jgi:molecular chaperone DnaK (HSP70)
VSVISEKTTPRYVVGIDLGTTNSAVTFVDCNRRQWKIELFAIHQTVAPGEVEPRDTLPSFHYQAAEGELAEGALRLPWEKKDNTTKNFTVGIFAREHGAEVPGRLISSAKSWLSHAAVDRTADLLPWHASDEIERYSPIEIAGRYLNHIRLAWNNAHPNDLLEDQDIVLTLPASFDEVARQLTIKAAAAARLPRILLIEEPQAAFYAWIYRHTDRWEQLVTPGQKILVCDVGGGTSDFTLIRVRKGRDGEIQFHRVAVGNHLILGGDNLDLALALALESRISPDKKLPSRAWGTLLGKCRQIKETLLGDNSPESVSVNLPATGSKLIGGGTQIELTRKEVEHILLDGFFPKTTLDEKPTTGQSGFQEFGLPYAADPAVTKYLAAFLGAHRHDGLPEEQTAEKSDDPARPDIILFNGGLFESSAIRNRILEVITGWFDSDNDSNNEYKPTVLEPDRLDLAVARGAAYYGMVRRGEGVRIAANLARTYYVGIDSQHHEASAQAICLVGAEAEPGDDVLLEDRTFELLVSNPVEFPLYVSSTRLTDQPGQLIPIDLEQMTPLPPIRTVLRKRKASEPDRVNVQLETCLSEIGTLQLYCAATDSRRRWRLEFDVRSTTQTDLKAHQSEAESEGFLDESLWEQFDQLLERTFGPKAELKPSRLIKELRRSSEMGRTDWPTSLLRQIWAKLIELSDGRKKSENHEARWLNLLGFSLRPGYGLAADDWRVAESWKLLQSGLAYPGVTCRTEWWIFWRRIAAGLTAGWQQSLAEPLLSPLRDLHRQMTTGKGSGAQFGDSTHETSELLRGLGSFEHLSAERKTELGQILLDLYPRRRMEPVRQALLWTLGRLGARVPVYGPLNTVVPPQVAADWTRQLIAIRDDNRMIPFAVMELARRCDDRYRDLADSDRQEAVGFLKMVDSPRHYIDLIRESRSLEADEQGLVFGESLPKGLKIK